MKDKDSENFKCDLCGSMFTRRSALGGHKSKCSVVPVKEILPEPCTCYKDSGLCQQHEGDAW